MNIKDNLLPHILCAMSSSPEQKQNLIDVVKFVKERLGCNGKQIGNIRNDVEKALQIATEIGLLTRQNSTIRMRYNPNSKPPLGFQLSETQDIEETINTDHENKSTNKMKNTKNEKSATNKFTPFEKKKKNLDEDRRRNKHSRSRNILSPQIRKPEKRRRKLYRGI